MHTRGRRDIDDGARLAIFDAEVGRGGADELKGRCAVQGNNSIPLLVGRLVDYAVPGEAGIVDNDVDLAATKVCGFLHEVFDVLIVEDVAGDGGSFAAGFVDAVGYFLGLFCGVVLLGDLCHSVLLG